MKTFNVHEAKTHLSRLLRRVARGEELVIARDGEPVALVHIYSEAPSYGWVDAAGEGLAGGREGVGVGGFFPRCHTSPLFRIFILLLRAVISLAVNILRVIGQVLLYAIGQIAILLVRHLASLLRFAAATQL